MYKVKTLILRRRKYNLLPGVQIWQHKGLIVVQNIQPFAICPVQSRTIGWSSARAPPESSVLGHHLVRGTSRRTSKKMGPLILGLFASSLVPPTPLGDRWRRRNRKKQGTQHACITRLTVTRIYVAWADLNTVTIAISHPLGSWKDTAGQPERNNSVAGHRMRWSGTWNELWMLDPFDHIEFELASRLLLLSRTSSFSDLIVGFWLEARGDNHNALNYSMSYQLWWVRGHQMQACCHIWHYQEIYYAAFVSVSNLWNNVAKN